MGPFSGAEAGIGPCSRSSQVEAKIRISRAFLKLQCLLKARQSGHAPNTLSEASEVSVQKSIQFDLLQESY